MRAVFFVLFAVGCGKYAPVDYQQSLRVEPVVGLPAVCLSFVPAAGRLPKSEASQWLEVREAIQVGDLTRANERVAGLGPHPARASVQAVYALVEGSSPPDEEALRALVEQYPDDACLLQMAGTAMLGANAAVAQEWIAAAGQLNPDDPDVALMTTVFQVQSPAERQERLVDLANTYPEHAATQVFAGRVSVSVGELDDAVIVFERAFALGAEEVGESLYHLRRMSGKLDAYLLQAADDGEPVSAVQFGEHPMEALDSWLGLKSETDHLEAIFDTSEGEIRCSLFHRKAPVTVLNFVALARGQQAWTDPASGETSEAPLYDGTLFHRVIPEFMIQGGDPLGTGQGFPGYRFRDELHPELGFDRPGRLAMANSGPDTNGSQFFITEAPTPHLDGMHTIFGQCTGLDVVEAIARVPASGSRPDTDVVLNTVRFEVKPCETCTH